MKQLIPILFLFIACSNAEVETIVVKEHDTDSVLIKKDSTIKYQSMQLDTMYAHVFNLLDDRDSLNKYKALISKIKLQKLNPSDSIKLLAIENLLVKNKLNKAVSMYEMANSKAQVAQKENEILKRKYSKPVITGVTVKCEGFKSRGFLRRAAPYETVIAKEVKRITVKFIIPENKFIDESKVYNFHIKIGTILEKPVHLKLNGKEVRIDDKTIVFEIVDLLKPGDYIVTIEVDGVNESATNLTLK